MSSGLSKQGMDTDTIASSLRYCNVEIYFSPVFLLLVYIFYTTAVHAKFIWATRCTCLCHSYHLARLRQVMTLMSD